MKKLNYNQGDNLDTDRTIESYNSLAESLL